MSLSTLSTLSSFSSFLSLQAELRRAAALFDAGRYGEARAVLEAQAEQAALAAGTVMAPQGRVRIAHALGVVAEREDDLAAARRHYGEALALSPNDAEARVDLAMLRIAAGEHGPGFAEYEWRLVHPTKPCVLRRHTRPPLGRWSGGALPAGEPLLLHAEQGFGDTLLFLRHLPAVRRRIGPGVPLWLALPSPLRRLVAEAFLPFHPELRPIRLCTFREPLPLEHGLRWQCPLLSLPHVLGLEGEALFAPAPPYLFLPADALPAQNTGRPKIGLVWRAGAESEGGRYRSVPLEALLPLANLPAEWLGLQKEPTGDELALLDTAFHGRDASPVCRDFLETARLLASLDLLVTNDTAAAHLAGALGLPAFVLLPRSASWRWPRDGKSDETTPWHPTLRLFRQTENNAWAAPVLALKDALAARFAGRWPDAGEAAALPRVPTPPEERELALIEAQLLHEKGDYPGVRAVLEPCAVRHPRHAPLLRALGMARLNTGDPAGALCLYRRALKLEPTNPDLRFSLAFLRLYHGDFKKGFAEYEARFDRENCIEPRCAEGAPLWDGRPLAADQPLLIHCEQGLGDAIQFIRLLPWARERAGAAPIHLVCASSLLRLFRESPVAGGLAGYLTDGGTIPKHAFHCPLLSLARLSGLRLETIPQLPPVPYLTVPDPAPRPPGAARRIGLVWKSRLPDGSGRSKSLPLAALLPLADLLDIAWVILQKERTDEETALLASRFGIAPGGPADPGPALPDFAATAREIAALDLVIACDTATAHLAGALGKPVWVPLQTSPDWRWLAPGVNPAGDDRNPWYPTMHLFRQQAHGDWSGPVGAMGAALKRF